LEDFSAKAVNNEKVLNVTGKMEVEIDNALKREEKVDPTRVDIRTVQGKMYSKQIEDPLGSLERPMSFDDCAKKFRDCAKNLPEKQTDRVIEQIQRLEQIEDISEIISSMVFK